MLSICLRSVARLQPSIAVRAMHCSPARWAAPPSDALFKAAAAAVQQLASSPSNEDKLALYALFKQATTGKNTSSKPGRRRDRGLFNRILLI